MNQQQPSAFRSPALSRAQVGRSIANQQTYPLPLEQQYRGATSRQATITSQCESSFGDHPATSTFRPLNLLEQQRLAEANRPRACECIIRCFSMLLFLLTFPASLFCALKVVQEYERAVIFRIGRVDGGPRGPGVFFVYPCIDKIRVVDLRTRYFDIPPQEILTRDSVTVAVDAVLYYRIENSQLACMNVENADRSSQLLAATTLRTVLGTKKLTEILSDRENIGSQLSQMIDGITGQWGVKVERIEIKDVRLPSQMQRAMAAEVWLCVISLLFLNFLCNVG